MRRGWPFAVMGLVVAIVAVGLLRGAPEPGAVESPATAPPARHPPSAAPRPADSAPPPRAAPAPTAGQAAPDAPAPEAAEEIAEPEIDPNAEQDAIAAAWATVDMEAVRAAMPDNLYFKLAAPTKDEAVIEERAAERRRWNEEYGKVLSGTATEEEIGAFFDRRARVSTDYVEFTTHLLDHYRDTLHERDVALLELARRMHATRLQEIPHQVEEALVRKRQQDEARAAWLAEEAEFRGGADPAP